MDGIKGVGVGRTVVEQDFINKNQVQNNVATVVNPAVGEHSHGRNETHDTLRIGKDRAEELDMFKENFEKLKKIFRGEAEFKIDRDTNMVVIKIKDPETGEVLRQIPPELALKLAKNIQELLGVLMDERV